MPTTIEALNTLPPQVKKGINAANALFLPGNKLLAEIGRNGHTELVPAAQAWRAAGVSESTISQILTPDGAWGNIETPFLDPNTILQLLNEPDAEKVIAQLMQMLTVPYEPVQPFLDQYGYDPRHGYNSHSLLDHILVMARRAVKLTQAPEGGSQGPVSVLDRNLSLLAILLHDETNSQSRKFHALALRYKIPLLFGTENVLNCPSLAPAFLAAIMHDERSVALPFFMQIMKDSLPEGTKNITTELVREIQETVRQKVSMVESLLLILDKSDIGLNRVQNTRDVTGQALAEDKHFLANIGYLLAYLGLSDQGQTFLLRYNFRFTAQDEVPDTIKAYVQREHGGGRKISVPTSLKDTFSQEGLSYFEQINSLVLELYRERFLLAAVAAFNLYPKLKCFKLEFINTDPADEQMKTKQELRWTREEVWNELLALQIADQKKVH